MKVLLIFIFVMFSITLFSQQSNKDSKKENKGYDFLISGGIGKPYSPKQAGWNYLYSDGVLVFLGCEFSLNQKHTWALEINGSSWIFKNTRKDTKSSLDYLHFVNDLYYRLAFHPVLKFYTADSEANLRLAFGLGYVLLSSDHDYKGLEILGAIHYKIDQNINLSVEFAPVIGSLPTMDGSSTYGKEMPSWIGLKFNYILR